MDEQLVQALVQVSDNISFSAEWITPLSEALAGVDATEAAWKPAPDERSIWEITNHVIAWTDWVVHFLSRQDIEVIDWPPVTRTDGAAWETTCQALRDKLTAFREQIASTNASDLFKMPTPEVTKTTCFAGINSILIHNAYHAGQITKLRERYQQAVN